MAYTIFVLTLVAFSLCIWAANEMSRYEGLMMDLRNGDNDEGNGYDFRPNNYSLCA